MRPVISTVKSKLKAFSLSQTGAYIIKVATIVIFRKWYKIDTSFIRIFDKIRYDQ